MQQQTAVMGVVPPVAPQITSSVQQSLTEEAAEIMASASADALRRHHSHISPLHVFVALLSARRNPYLRRACTFLQAQKTPYPLLPTCRALDLCFSVALDRLPSLPSPSPPSFSPPFANSLVAALKRAQAIQRRGSPDHPLISVCVDHIHLIVSILDDPSVSRVMREAGFSSVAVKGLLLPSSNYLNPRLVQGQEIAVAIGSYRKEIEKVAEVLSRNVKRNPILVGDSGVDFLMEDVLGLIKRGEFGSICLVSLSHNINKMERFQMVQEIRKAGSSVTLKLLVFEGAILDLGDLKWIVESPETEAGPSAIRHREIIKERHKVMIETAQIVIAEVASILKKHASRVWVIGTATCATYLRCQVYHPSMEKEWDLKVLPITPRSLVGLSPSLGGKGILSSSVEALNTSKGLGSNFNTNSTVPTNHSVEIAVPCTRPQGVCNTCLKNYDEEVLVQMKKTSPYFSHLVQLNFLWNQLKKEDKVILDQRIQETNHKWQDTCKRLHCYIESMPNSDTDTRGVTDLSLGLPAYSAPSYDSDTLLKLSKGLVNNVSWQPEAAMSIASIVMQIKSGSKKRCGLITSKFDTWLLYTGPDMIGKRRMASSLSKLFFGAEPITVDFGPRRESANDEPNTVLRGKTMIDRVVDAVRSNPLCVIVLEGMDQSDNVVQQMIKRAIETGRLTDSNGREVALGSSIFVIITEGEAKENILDLANLNWHLRLSIHKRKRQANWDLEEESRVKRKKDNSLLSLDLNLAVILTDDDENNDHSGEGKEGSPNFSDVTVERGHALARLSNKHPNSSDLTDLFNLVDQVVPFKSFDLSVAKLAVSQIISKRFKQVMGTKMTIDIDAHVFDKMAHTIWYSEGTNLMDEWADKVLVPAFQQLKNESSFEDGDTVRLSVAKGQVSCQIVSSCGSPFPVSVVVAVGGA
ncbi:hypothetical protein LUZ60_000777 [Juncus effusus]|nr:hypothetical protein LUZ60_000777 [Juncus effusus]